MPIGANTVAVLSADEHHENRLEVIPQQIGNFPFPCPTMTYYLRASMLIL